MSTFSQENEGNYTILYPGIVFEYIDDAVTISFDDEVSFDDLKDKKPQLCLKKDKESKKALDHLINVVDVINNDKGGVLRFIKSFIGLTDFEKVFIVLLDDMYTGTKLKIYQRLIDIRDSYQS